MRKSLLIVTFIGCCLLIKWQVILQAAIASVNVSYCTGTNCGTGSSSTIKTDAISLTGGNFYAAGFRMDNPATKCNTVTDTAGNAVHLAHRYNDAGGFLEVDYVYNATGNASNQLTCTVDSSSTYGAAVVHQFSGVATLCDPLVNAQEGNGNSTSLSTATITGISGSTIFAFMQYFGATDNYTAGTGYTGTRFAIPGDVLNYFFEEYHAVSANEAATATHDNGAANWAIVGFSFRDTCPAAGTGGLLTLGVGR